MAIWEGDIIIACLSSNVVIFIDIPPSFGVLRSFRKIDKWLPLISWLVTNFVKSNMFYSLVHVYFINSL